MSGERCAGTVGVIRTISKDQFYWTQIVLSITIADRRSLIGTSSLILNPIHQP